MGVALKDILEYEQIELSSISNKKIAIDSFNMIYQFLASIRQADGTSLTDSKGNVTSHLKGLFNRCVYFKKNNIKAVFVFDGEAPKLKEAEREIRQKKKEDAKLKYQAAIDNDDLVEAKKHAQALNRLTPEMVKDSIALIEAFGFPVVQAPSEGEAQAGRLCNEGKVFAACSQDFDSLLFGTKYLIRNLSVSNKRKVPGSSVYRDVPIEFYELDKVLDKLQISLDELIIVAILCGTDFNPGGIKGIGPKKALKLVREYKDRWDEIFTNLKWHDTFSHTWVEVFNVFKQMKTENVEVEFKTINKDSIREILQAHDFELMMIDRSLNGIKNVKTLDAFF